MRVVFMGSPDFALPSLRALVEVGYDVVGVFTQPDKPGGRGRKLVSPPVKTFAAERDLPVFQPRSISKPDSLERMRALRPEVGVIAAYGQILKQPVLDIPPLGVLNVHASLLPRWRGASPVTAAILAGDTESGATIMKVVLELDAGPILQSVTVPVTSNDDAAVLTERISLAGADLLVDVLPRYASGELTPIPQGEAGVTYAPQVKKHDALIRWSAEPAIVIQRKVKAYNSWPVAYAYLDGQPLRILDAVALEHHTEAPPGTIFAWNGEGEAVLQGAAFGVTTMQGDLSVERVQPPGGRAMSAAAYLNGHRDIVGKRLTEEP